MTLELKLLAFTIRAGVNTNYPRIACCKPATWLCLDGRLTGRGRARIDRACGPTGPSAAEFRRDVSSVRCSWSDRTSDSHAQLDDRVGCSALFLGSYRLSRIIRSRGFSLTLPRMERGCARDHHGPSFTHLIHGWPIEYAACSGLNCVIMETALYGVQPKSPSALRKHRPNKGFAAAKSGSLIGERQLDGQAGGVSYRKPRNANVGIGSKSIAKRHRPRNGPLKVLSQNLRSDFAVGNPI